eukprot:1149770-Pelagomonas_calceolata.AAC.1
MNSYRASQCSRVLLRGRDPFSTWAAPNLKDLGTSPEEELMNPTATASCQGGPEAGEGTRSLLLKPGGQGQGACVSRWRCLRTPQMK